MLTWVCCVRLFWEFQGVRCRSVEAQQVRPGNIYIPPTVRHLWAKLELLCIHWFEEFFRAERSSWSVWSVAPVARTTGGSWEFLLFSSELNITFLGFTGKDKMKIMPPKSKKSSFKKQRNTFIVSQKPLWKFQMS